MGPYTGGRENEPLPVLHALAHDGEVRLEVELEHAQGIGDVLRRVRDRHERHDDVAFLDVILDPLPVDGDISFDEVESRARGDFRQFVVEEVHRVDLPGPRAQDRGGQCTADETVRTQNHHLQRHGESRPRRWACTRPS